MLFAAPPEHNLTRSISNPFQIVPCILWLGTESQTNRHRQKEKLAIYKTRFSSSELLRMFRPLKTLRESFCCSGPPSSPTTFFFFAYLVNFSTSQAQPNAPLYEGELTVFLRANTVWNDLRYGIQLFCSRVCLHICFPC